MGDEEITIETKIPLMRQDITQNPGKFSHTRLRAEFRNLVFGNNSVSGEAYLARRDYLLGFPSDAWKITVGPFTELYTGPTDGRLSEYSRLIAYELETQHGVVIEPEVLRKAFDPLEDKLYEHMRRVSCARQALGR